MIARVWYGWTEFEDADEYEAFVTDEVLPDAEASIEECLGGDVLRRERAADVEFVTVIRFASLDGVREFAGDEYEQAHVPEPARELLSEFEEKARHYEVA